MATLSLDPNQKCINCFKCRSSEVLRSFNPSKGTHLLILMILAGDIELNPGPRSQCRLCKIYCKAANKVVECEDCKDHFHASRANLGNDELEKLESGIELGIVQSAKLIVTCVVVLF